MLLLLLLLPRRRRRRPPLQAVRAAAPMGLAFCKPCCCGCCGSGAGGCCDADWDGDDDGDAAAALRQRLRARPEESAARRRPRAAAAAQGGGAGGAGSAPVPLVGAAGGAAAASAGSAARLAKEPLLLRPPSVEDEKKFMRASLSSILEAQARAQAECTLCLEGFSEQCPGVRTLCKCGANKHPYHLACLLEWRQRSRKTTCPVCDHELFFEQAGSGGSAGDGEEEGLTRGSLAASIEDL